MAAITIEEPSTRQADLSEAFKTKFGGLTKERQRSREIKTPQHRLQIRQIFPPNTWLIDLVRFKAESDDERWYVFFVEANTRYLMIYSGNGNWITEDAWVRQSSRVPSDTFQHLFEQFLANNRIVKDDIVQVKPVKRIVADSERAFWSRSMMNFYASHRIETQRINVKEEGHIRLAILDRIVRTIRDMLFNLKSQSFTIDDLQEVARVYNNTKHRILKATPQQAHNDPTLEMQFINTLQGTNFQIQHQADYELQPGTIVSVRAQLGPFEKRRTTVLPDDYEVVERMPQCSFKLRNVNDETDVIVKPRRD